MRLGDPINVADYDSIFGEPKRHRSPSLLTKAMLYVIVIGISLGFSLSAARDAETRPLSIEKEALSPADQIWLSFPIPYTATVTQCDTKHGCRTRYYAPKLKGKE